MIGARGALVRFARARDGNTAIEAAFILPVFLTMVLGFCFFGYAMFAQHEMTNALLAGARYAMVHGASSTAPASVQQIKDQVGAGSSFLSPKRLNVSVQFAPDNKPGSTVVLGASYQLVSLPALKWHSALTISDQTRITIMN